MYKINIDEWEPDVYAYLKLPSFRAECSGVEKSMMIDLSIPLRSSRDDDYIKTKKLRWWA